MSNEYEAGELQQVIDGDCADLGCRRGQIAQALYQGILTIPILWGRCT